MTSCRGDWPPPGGPAPRCTRCGAPATPDNDCRYCQRYKRACGRHDRDHTCAVRVTP